MAALPQPFFPSVLIFLSRSRPRPGRQLEVQLPRVATVMPQSQFVPRVHCSVTSCGGCLVLPGVNTDRIYLLPVCYVAILRRNTKRHACSAGFSVTEPWPSPLVGDSRQKLCSWATPSASRWWTLDRFCCWAMPSWHS